MKKLKLIAFWMAMLSFWGCSNKCPDQYGDEDDGVQKQYFSPSYERTTNNWQPVVGAFGYIHQDSVKLYDQNYTEIKDFVADVGGDLFFTYIDQNTPKEEDITKTYYLYLSYQDTDTIRHEYRVRKEKCRFQLDYGRFFYNNKLITSSKNNKAIPYATFNKN